MTGDRQAGDPLPEPIFPLSPANEVADELEFHIEMRTRELVARGVDPADARRQALQRFQDFRHVTDECHQIAEQREHTVRRTRYITNFAQDVAFAVRMLRHRLGFAVMALLPLALGIGATTAMFSVVDGVMLRPLPFTHPERLVAIWATENAWKNDNASAIAWNSVVIGQQDYDALRDRARMLSQVAAWGRDGGMLGDAAGSFTQVSGVRVTASIFDLLGVHPLWIFKIPHDFFQIGWKILEQCIALLRPKGFEECVESLRLHRDQVENSLLGLQLQHAAKLAIVLKGGR